MTLDVQIVFSPCRTQVSIWVSFPQPWDTTVYTCISIHAHTHTHTQYTHIPQKTLYCFHSSKKGFVIHNSICHLNYKLTIYGTILASNTTHVQCKPYGVQQKLNLLLGMFPKTKDVCKQCSITKTLAQSSSWYISHVAYVIYLWLKYISKKLIGGLNKLPE